MAAKLHVLRRYFTQLKLARRRFVKAVGAAVLASASLDVAVPAIVATILEKLSGRPSLTECVGLLIALFSVFVMGCGLIPVRIKMRRLLQDEGHTRLMEEIRDTIRVAPSLGKEMGPSARKEFIDTWERFTTVLIDQFVPFVIGILGLVGILAFRAPWVIPPVLGVLLGTIFIAHKVGRTTGSKWEVYKTNAHAEHEAMDDFAASADMQWLADAVSKPLQRAGESRSKAMRNYVSAMASYQLTMNALSSAFKFSAVVGGVVLGAGFGATFGVTSFLVIYGLGLGNQMSTAFSMSDMVTSYAVDAEVVVRLLEDAEPLGPELRTPLPIIELRDVVVKYPPSKRAIEKARAAGKPLPSPVYVSLPDVEIGPGVNIVTGPNGFGKSTFLKATGGLVTFEGTILIGGVKVKGNDPRARIVHVEQEIKGLKRALASDLFINPESERTAMALRCAGLNEPPSLDRLLQGEYSGGQKNCIIIAGAFSTVLGRDRSMAGLLGLDEPTNHLDKKVVPRFIAGIREIADQDPRLAILIVTHDPRMFDIADRIIRWDKV